MKTHQITADGIGHTRTSAADYRFAAVSGAETTWHGSLDAARKAARSGAGVGYEPRNLTAPVTIYDTATGDPVETVPARYTAEDLPALRRVSRPTLSSDRKGWRAYRTARAAIARLTSP